MRNLALTGGAAVLLTLALSPANAQRLLQPWEYSLTPSPAESNLGVQAVGNIYNSSLGASAGGTASNTVGIVEDYTSISPDALNALSQHIFVGGVARAGDVLFFGFYDTTNALTGSYGVSLPQAGNFVWTVNITNPQTVLIPNIGSSVMIPDNGANNVGGTPTTATFRFSNVAPTVGTTTGTIYRQSLTTVNFVAPVPEPGTVALLVGFGVSGLVLRRRVRK